MAGKKSNGKGKDKKTNGQANGRRVTKNGHLVGRPPSVTWARFLRLCEDLELFGTRYAVCQRHGFVYETVRSWMQVCAERGDTKWRERWDLAIEMFRDSLEDEALRRAVAGTERPVFYKGEVCGHITEYDSALLQMRLRAERPEKYRDNANVVGNLAVGVLVVPAAMTPDEWVARYGKKPELPGPVEEEPE